jgi:ankyrin repeat protein
MTLLYFQLIQHGLLSEIKNYIYQLNINPEFIIDKKGRNGLLISSKYGHYHIIKYFIEELHFSLYTRDYRNKNIINYSHKYNHSEIIEYVVDIYIKYIINNDIENVKYLREYFQLYDQEYQGIGVLALACSYGHMEIVEYFLQKGYDVNYIDTEGSFALIQAAGNGQLDIVRMLVIQNADINLQNDFGMSALGTACEFSDNLPIIQYLLDQGAYINIKDMNKDTPLFRAIQCNHPHIVEYLLSRYAEMSRFTFYPNGKIIPLQYINLKKQNVFDYAKSNPEIQKILYKYWLRHAIVQIPFSGKKMYKMDPRNQYENRKQLMNEIYYVPPLFERHLGGLGYQEAMSHFYSDHNN